MSITIANATFNNVKYYALSDVLYLNVGDHKAAVVFDDTPEGHNVGWNAAGELVSIALLHPRRLREQHGEVAITLPQHLEVGSDALDQALVAAQRPSERRLDTNRASGGSIPRIRVVSYTARVELRSPAAA